MLPGASVTVRVRWPAAGRVTGTNRLRRPRQGDQGAAGGRPAMIGSASQCPPAALSSAWGGRRPVGGAPVSGSLPLGSGFSGQWGARVCGGCVRCAGPPPPATGRRGPPAPWTHPGPWVDLLANRVKSLGVVFFRSGGDGGQGGATAGAAGAVVGLEHVGQVSQGGLGEVAAFAVLPLLVALAGRIRSGGVRSRCRGRPGATSARRLISRPKALDGVAAAGSWSSARGGRPRRPLGPARRRSASGRF